MSPDKGCHVAIEVAKTAELPLRIAAKLHERHEEECFAECIEPHLGGEIEYLGEVDHDEKVALLGGALATLSPVDVEEAFGLVMAESMACGTPVIALRRGSVPEVVEHGRTGVIVDRPEEMVDALDEVRRLVRDDCRRRVEERFSTESLVRSYEQAFARAVSDGYEG